jgi:CheY-like chemotaxis protein
MSKFGQISQPELVTIRIPWRCPMSPSVHPEMPSGVVLCIDHNQETLECERSFLESFGYTVLTASSGGRGLELASSHSVDVVVLGYRMPAMNAQEVAIAMRRLRPEAPIILLTEGAGVSDRTLSLVDALIAKDRLASQLLPTIAHLQGCGWTPPPSFDA